MYSTASIRASASAYSPAWSDALLGAAVCGARQVYRSALPVAHAASAALRLTAGQLPVPGAATLATHGEQARADLEQLVDAVLAAVVRRVVNTLVETVDLTALVRENVDIVALAVDVVDAIDLPEIVRESTGTMASDAVQALRTGGMQADDAVSRLFDRLLPRSRSTRPS
ncbi:MAG: hypothetical protein J2P19_23125 [Pseudonocardia sp.]|nr:hypothetical protein [Pseudonocardia sp.]